LFARSAAILCPFSFLLFGAIDFQDHMADDAQQEDVGLEVEEWTDPVDITVLGDDGPSTIFVGGFSDVRTAKDGLEKMIYRDDKLVFLEGQYEGNLILDSTYLDGVQIVGEGAVVFSGQLVVAYSSYDPDRLLKIPVAAEVDDGAAVAAAEPGEDAAPPPEEEAEEEGEEGKKAVIVRAPKIALSNMKFLGGVSTEGLATGYVDDCEFGTPFGEPPLDYCATIASLSDVLFTRSKFYGSGKSVVYAFPRARGVFTECTFEGSIPAVTQTETIRRRRGYVPPPPPPPTAPTTVHCEVGLYFDDADIRVERSVVSQVGIGILCHDTCRDTVIEECLVTKTSTTGILLMDSASPKIVRSRVNLNGRESLVVGNHSHPNIRSCAFAGDVRLKTHAVHTGLTDNLIGLNRQLEVEGKNFYTKGFTVVPTDPTFIKPKKVVVEEDE
jgi:hypothetical protein